jgi:hypothetical protein
MTISNFRATEALYIVFVRDKNAEQMLIKNMICECNIVTLHRVDFSCNVIFEDYMLVPQFAEKMVGLILFKIFSRVKQFIENVKI